MSGTIHLWKFRLERGLVTKCGMKITDKTNVLWASTAVALQVNPSWVCKTCYRLGPPWLVVVR